MEEYTVEEIQSALPSYYSEIKPRIEIFSEEIALLRTEKRFNCNRKEETAIDEYPKIIEEIQGYYKSVNAAVPSLLEIRQKNEEEKKKDIIVQWVIPIASIIIGTVIGIVGWFF